jgi:hypothetical protein
MLTITIDVSLDAIATYGFANLAGDSYGAALVKLKSVNMTAGLGVEGNLP